MPETAVLEHSGDGTTDSVEVGSETASLAQARHIVTQYLAKRCPWADGAAVALVLSELLANAVRHAGGWWRLHATGNAERLVVEVRDRSDTQPRLLAPNLHEGSGGLGMHIVTKLTTRLEIEPDPGHGKVVRVSWHRLPREGGSSGPSPAGAYA